MAVNGRATRRRALLLIGAYLVVVMFLIDRLLYSLALETPRFFVLLGYFFAVKLLGDVVYYRLRPQYRDYGNIGEYLVEDALALLRFGFPLVVAQRLVETSFIAALLGPRSVLMQLVAGPYAAIAIYLVNRYLREEVADTRFHAGERLHRLP